MEKSQTYQIWTRSIHLLFWGLMSVIMYLVWYRILDQMQVALIATVMNLAVILPMVYVHLYILLPNWFEQKRYLQYGLGIIGLLLGTTFLRFYVGKWLNHLLDWELQRSFTPNLLISLLFGGILFLVLTTPLRLIGNWFQKRELEQTFKTHQLEAELRFLKAQVNPHFLFNALNNIYSLAFTQSPQTPDMILRLSDMMRYMLYDCKSEQVELDAEIAYLRNYIALQQLKKEGQLDISFEVKGETGGMRISPMLFIPFFENAFKHGLLEQIDRGWLKSELRTQAGEITFNIRNNFSVRHTDPGVGGVGLQNIRERLQLLFADRHQLTIRQEQNIYTVELTLTP
ncbi:MAG: histidine kinase [Bacteroidota bacterium]